MSLRTERQQVPEHIPGLMMLFSMNASKGDKYNAHNQSLRQPVAPLDFHALRGLAWVQVQASTEEIDGGLEILDVPEPAGSEFHRRDP